MSTVDDAPESVAITTRILLDLLRGRQLTIRDVMDEHDRSYQQARRYLHAIDQVVDLKVERGDERQNVYRLDRQSVPVHPDVYHEDTGQLPLFESHKQKSDDETDSE